MPSGLPHRGRARRGRAERDGGRSDGAAGSRTRARRSASGAGSLDEVEKPVTAPGSEGGGCAVLGNGELVDQRVPVAGNNDVRRLHGARVSTEGAPDVENVDSGRDLQS